MNDDLIKWIVIAVTLGSSVASWIRSGREFRRGYRMALRHLESAVAYESLSLPNALRKLRTEVKEP